MHLLCGFHERPFDSKPMIEHLAPVQLSLLPENLYKHKFLLQYLMQILNKGRCLKRPRMLKTACFTENTSYLLSEHRHQHIHPRSCEDLLFYAFTFSIFASTGENNRFPFHAYVHYVEEEGGKVLN